MKEKILNLEIGNQIDWKFGLITKYVIRIEENLFQIHDTSDIWSMAKVNKQQITDLLDGKLSII
jgi:hypothetical protein